jgi:hypothetical protein
MAVSYVLNKKVSLIELTLKETGPESIPALNAILDTLKEIS